MRVAYLLLLCLESFFLSVQSSALTLCCGLCLLSVVLVGPRQASSKGAAVLAKFSLVH